jgi:hypothetical protein
MNPIDFQNTKLKCILKNKKFISVSDSLTGKSLKFKLENIFIPFGAELYNDKYVVNLEFEKTNNIHNNYISVIQSLEKNIINNNFETEINVNSNIINKNFFTSIKDSKLGNILRTHLTKTTEIFILRENGTKYDLDKENLKGSTVNIEIKLKGIWIVNESYGFYWDINSIHVTKFN